MFSDENKQKKNGECVHCAHNTILHHIQSAKRNKIELIKTTLTANIYKTQPYRNGERTHKHTASEAHSFILLRIFVLWFYSHIEQYCAHFKRTNMHEFILFVDLKSTALLNEKQTDKFI